MSGYSYSTSSFNKLMTCDIRLRRVFFKVIKYTDVKILWGHRDEEAQNEFFEKNLSKNKWPNSLHNKCPSLAVDVVPYPIDWEDTFRFYKVATLAYEIAIRERVRLHWGGTWPIMKKSDLFDGVHFYLKEDAQ